MSFGEHLEELRTCLIRALLGIALAAGLALIFGRSILQLLFLPLWRVQIANDLQPNVQSLAPTDAFSAYLKMSLAAGLIVSMPWVLLQIWNFVHTGLYPHERRFVKWLTVASSGLFIVGVLFLYFLVLPVVLQFFISFNRAFEPIGWMPTAAAIEPQSGRSPAEASANPSRNRDGADAGRAVPADSEPPTSSDADVPADERALPREGSPPLAKSSEAETRRGEGGQGGVDQAPPDLFRVPLLTNDPPDPQPGQLWVNTQTRRLVLWWQDRFWSMALTPGPIAPAVESQFAVPAYISFVLMLALAFGIAFETPIVVVFLAWSNLVQVDTFKRYRRHVVLGIVFASAILTPTTDLLSQSLLAIPMYLLFEAGLYAAKILDRKRAARVSA
jgi:Sec-independent protein secretion pathway component TatC